MSNGALLRDPVICSIAEAHGKHLHKSFSAGISRRDFPLFRERRIPITSGKYPDFDFELTDEEMARIRSLNQEKRFFNMSLEDKERVYLNTPMKD